jgi:hypothetical protein
MAATNGRYREKEFIFLSWVMEPAEHHAHPGDARFVFENRIAETLGLRSDA